MYKKRENSWKRCKWTSKLKKSWTATKKVFFLVFNTIILPWILLCQTAPLCHIQFHFCFQISTTRKKNSHLVVTLLTRKKKRVHFIHTVNCTNLHLFQWKGRINFCNSVNFEWWIFGNVICWLWKKKKQKNKNSCDCASTKCKYIAEKNEVCPADAVAINFWLRS